MNKDFKDVYCEFCNDHSFDNLDNSHHECGELYFICVEDAIKYLPESPEYIAVFSYGFGPAAEAYVCRHEHLLDVIAAGQTLKLKVCSSNASLLVSICEGDDVANGECFTVVIEDQINNSGHPYFKKVRLKAIADIYLEDLQSQQLTREKITGECVERLAVIADQKMNLTEFTDAKKERLFWLLMSGE